MLLRVADGGRAADEDRVGVVVAAEAAQAADQHRHVAAEDAAVAVKLIDHDVAEGREEVGPAGVVGEDAAVQHVGIGEEDVGLVAEGAALGLRGVAVVGAAVEAEALDAVAVTLEGLELILGEGLGGEEVERAAGRVGEKGLEDGRVVAEGLATGSGGDDDDVVAGADVVDGLGLVGVKLVDAVDAEGGEEGFGQGGRHRSIARLARGDLDGGGELAAVLGAVRDIKEKAVGVHGGLARKAGGQVEEWKADLSG